jgi:tol-pal system protein YbgF
LRFTTLFKYGRATLCALGLGLCSQAATAQTLPGELSGLTFNNDGGRILVAQADNAQLMVRVQQLEEQIRVLNGQVEGLTFQLTQLQEILTRLEAGGASAQPEALPAPANENAVPQTDIPEQGVQPLPGEVEFDPTFDDGSADQLGQSADPLAGSGATGGSVDLATGQPLDLSFDPNTTSGNADADAQLRAGVEAVQAGNYEFAEEQLGQFIDLYPDSPQLVEASSWLGDALIARAAYAEAADVLVEAYQKNPEDPRAADVLFKLGISLAGVGERETACRTFNEVGTRYPQALPALQTRLTEERAKAECPPA